jgi:hypothetical protein
VTYLDHFPKRITYYDFNGVLAENTAPVVLDRLTNLFTGRTFAVARIYPGHTLELDPQCTIDRLWIDKDKSLRLWVNTRHSRLGLSFGWYFDEYPTEVEARAEEARYENLRIGGGYRTDWPRDPIIHFHIEGGGSPEQIGVASYAAFEWHNEYGVQYAVRLTPHMDEAGERS